MAPDLAVPVIWPPLAAGGAGGGAEGCEGAEAEAG